MKLTKPSSVPFLMLLTACGSTVFELSKPAASEPTQTTASGSESGDSQPVIPPQPVIGSYLAASFEIPALATRDECYVALSENGDSYTAELEQASYHLLPVDDVANLEAVTLTCEPETGSNQFSATKFFTDPERQLLKGIAIKTLESPVAYIAKFYLNPLDGAGSNGGISGSMECSPFNRTPVCLS